MLRRKFRCFIHFRCARIKIKTPSNGIPFARPLAFRLATAAGACNLRAGPGSRSDDAGQDFNITLGTGLVSWSTHIKYCKRCTWGEGGGGGTICMISVYLHVPFCHKWQTPLHKQCPLAWPNWIMYYWRHYVLGLMMCLQPQHYHNKALLTRQPAKRFIR